MKEDFIKSYCKKSNISKETFNRRLVALPLKCNADNCKGLAAIENEKMSLEFHYDLYKSVQNLTMK